jgi:TIR domain-containing protein
MKIFLSHVSQDRSTAEAIAFSLRDRSHKVFLDRDDLPVGHGFDQRIERAVKQSEIFIFLISPDSVTDGRYTLTELLFARKKWPSPSGHVLPVRVRTTPRDQIPPYLKAVTILEPQGNVAAETSAKVDEMGRHTEAAFGEASIDTGPSKAVNPLWAFLSQKKNREVLAWIGGGLVVVAAGVWALFVYVFPPKKDTSDAPNTQASCGGVAIGGNVSGSSITAGSTTNSECSPKSK